MMPQIMPPPRYVFVYGTLRAGGRNDIARYLPAPRRIGDGRIFGTLYDLGAYPGAVLGGASSIVGEVYAIDAAVEAELDVLEEIKSDDSGEYLKREVKVYVDGRELSCLLYEIQQERIVGKSVIANGDWLRRSPDK